MKQAIQDAIEYAKNNPVKKVGERPRRVFDFDSDKDISEYFLAGMKGFQALFPDAKIEVIRGYHGEEGFISLSECSPAKNEYYGAGEGGYYFAIRCSFEEGKYPFSFDLLDMLTAYVKQHFHRECNEKGFHPRGVISKSFACLGSVQSYGEKMSYFPLTIGMSESLKCVEIYFRSFPYSKKNEHRID